MKKHSEDGPDWQDQRKKIIGLGESSLRKSYYPALREKMAELEKKNEELQSAYEELTSGEEELRQNYEELSAKEHDLRESEEKYRNLIENTFDGVVIHQNRIIVYANRTAVRMLGWASPAGLLGKSIFDIAHPDFRQIVTERSAKALESAQLPRHELFLRNDGPALDVEVVATPTVWEGAPAVQVAFRDISAEKKAEAAIHEVLELNRAVVDNAPVGIIIYRATGRCISANAAAAKILGGTIGQLKSQDFRTLSSWKKHGLIDIAEKALASGEGSSVFTELTTTFGVHLWLNFILTPFMSAGELHLLTMFSDFTEQKQAEAALRQSEQRYRTLVETTETGFVIIDTAGRVVDANQKYVRMTGHRDLSEIVGRGVVEWTADYEKERNARAVEQCVKDGFIRNFEVDYVDSSGAITPIEVNATVVPDGDSSKILTLCRDISDRRKTEKALRESEQFYRTIFNTTGSASVIIGPDTTLLRANDGFARLSGYAIGELEGKHRWTEFVAQEDLEQMQNYHHLRRADPGRAPGSYEFRFVDREGTLRYCISYVAMIPGTEMSIASLVDISDRVIAEQELEKKNAELSAANEELAQNEERLRQNFEALSQRERELTESEHRNTMLLHAIPDMMFVISRDGVYRDFSVPDTHVLAVPVDQILGRNIRDSGFGDEPAEMMLNHIRLALETRELQLFEYELTLPQGRRQFEARLVALHEDAVLGIVRDITGQKQAEEELQRNFNELTRKEQELRSAKTHLEAIYEGSPDLIFVHAADGHIIDVNENVMRATGFTREEVLSAAPDAMSARGYTMAMAMGHLQTALGKGQAEFYWISKRKNGEEFPVEIRLRRIESINERGETEPRVLAIVRDITEQRMAEKALDEARKKLGLLNTVIFQDIQSTIFALSAYLQLAGSNHEEAKARAYAEKEAFLIHKIVSSLNFAKNYQDMGINPPRWQNVNQVFLYAISHLDSLKVLRNVQVDRLECYADPLLEKVFFNLVENIFLHGQRVTEISLDYQETEEGLLLVLQDNGVGILAEEKQKIFERGYGRNTGLGLFLVREILSITGITIRENGTEGEGARFEMLIPKGSYRFADMK
jgi:PAS domain S-box-containing protein